MSLTYAERIAQTAEQVAADDSMGYSQPNRLTGANAAYVKKHGAGDAGLMGGRTVSDLTPGWKPFMFAGSIPGFMPTGTESTARFFPGRLSTAA